MARRKTSEEIVKDDVKVEEKPFEKPVKMEEKIFKPYDVRVSINNLNLRKGPGKNFPKTGTFCKPGLQTIVKEKNGYGKRPDGLWIALDFCERV